MTDLERKLAEAFKNLSTEHEKHLNELNQKLDNSMTVVEHLRTQVINLSQTVEELNKRLTNKRGRRP